MEFSRFFAGPDDTDRRLDRILRRILFPERLPHIYSAIRKGLIRLNGSKATAETRVSSGDCISVASFLVPDSISKEKNPVTFCRQKLYSVPEVLFQNEYVQIVNKPYDLVVQGPNSLATFILEEWKREHVVAPMSLSFCPGPLHRLDRQTTGALVFSRNMAGARWFSSAFANHRIGKIYIGIITGHMANSETWIDTVSRSGESRYGTAFHTATISESLGKIAQTIAVPLSYGLYRNKPITFAEFSINTGRFHQIRLQASCHGYPLLGDTAYGSERISEEQNLFLHAYELRVPADNPLKVPEKIIAPISTNFQKMLNKTLIKWDGMLIL